MKKSNRAVEDKLQSLSEHRFGNDSAHDEATLIEAIGDKHSRVVAKAAELAGERLCYRAIASLKDAFKRFLDDPIKKDPQCIAKKAIARALVSLDCADAQFYISALSYRQMEPGWGPPTDSAVDIRVSSAMGLVNSGYPRALLELTSLLNDSEAQARIGALQAIACGTQSEAELLLRFKFNIGDREPEVVGECFAALLDVAGEEGVPLVAQRLSHQDAVVRELAAIALGESQLPEALAPLQQAWNTPLLNAEQKRSLTRAAAFHRSDAAVAWLISLIAEGSSSAAEAALDALSIYKASSEMKKRVQAALSERNDTKLSERFAQQWML